MENINRICCRWRSKMSHVNFKGGFWNFIILIKRRVLSSTNFMPDDLLEVICILEKGKKHNSYKIIRKRNYFSLITNFPAKNGESTPLKNCASAREQQLIRKRENFLPTTSYQIKGKSVEKTNLHMLLDLQLIIRIRNLKILPMFG